MEFINDRSGALDNFPVTQMDMSELTDTLPSVSLDNDNLERGPLLKDHYNNIEKLRKENFDLKIKLYLYESNENIVENSEFKSKLINEFDRKNNEIRFLNESLQRKNKEISEMRKRINAENNGQLLPSHAQIENEQLKSKLTESMRFCSCLLDQTKGLINLNRGLQKENHCDGKLLSESLIDKVSQFLTENSSLVSDIMSVKPNEDVPILVSTNHDQNDVKPNKISQSSNCDNLLLEFLQTIKKLRNLIEDFRMNKITYKLFLTNLDSVFEILSKQHKLLEKTHLDQSDRNAYLTDTKRRLADEIVLKQKIKSEIKKRIHKLDKIIMKTKDQL